LESLQFPEALPGERNILPCRLFCRLSKAVQHVYGILKSRQEDHPKGPRSMADANLDYSGTHCGYWFPVIGLEAALHSIDLVSRCPARFQGKCPKRIQGIAEKFHGLDEFTNHIRFYILGQRAG
jgi:hypothetical protein